MNEITRNAKTCALRLIWIGAVLFNGCGGPGEDQLVEEVFEKNYPVDPAAFISIRNPEGSILLYGGEGNEIKIRANKRAYGRERLEKIAINVTAQPGSVSIETTFPPKPKLGLADRSGTVDYVIIVPQFCSINRLELGTGELLIDGMRGKKIQANLVNGRLVAHNPFSDATLFVANGSLDIGYDWWETRPIALDAKIVNGGARLYLPRKAAVRLNVSAPNGAILNELAEKETRHGQVQVLKTSLGGGSESLFQLQATTGDVRIAEATP